METIEYINVHDRSEWGKGPWDDEPQDKIQWLDEASGLPCIVKRNPMGNWCGYVGVPAGHKFYQMDYENVDIEHPHGGLTYAAVCVAEGGPEHSICHIVEPGEPDDVWWLGFDCAHHMDVVPGLQRYIVIPDQTYRTLAFVQQECREVVDVGVR